MRELKQIDKLCIERRTTDRSRPFSVVVKGIIREEAVVQGKSLFDLPYPKKYILKTRLYTIYIRFMNIRDFEIFFQESMVNLEIFF